jgi:anaerobic C4-dicarboxylate transporter
VTISILLQFVVVLAAIWMGARYSGVGWACGAPWACSCWCLAFGVNPTSAPIDVMLIILAVIMAASVMDAAGGIDFSCASPRGIIRANPKYVTIVAPLTTWSFTFLAGTGHIVYPLLPSSTRPRTSPASGPSGRWPSPRSPRNRRSPPAPSPRPRPPMIGLFAEKGSPQWGLPQILMICVPSTLAGVVVAATVSMFLGKDLAHDPTTRHA